MLLNTRQSDKISEEKAKLLLARLENLVRSGKISSEEDFILEIEKIWTEILRDNLSCSVEVPEFRGGELPLRSLLEEPFYKAVDDINTLWNQYSMLREDLKDLFNRHLSEIRSLYSLLGVVQNKVAKAQLFSSDSEDMFVWSSDSFTSLEKVDTNLTSAFIDTSGFVTLRSIKLESLTKLIKKFTIDKSNSVGVPGNNMEILVEDGPVGPDEKSKEPQVTLVGKNDLRSQVSYMFDNQPNTWMEWEINNIPRLQKCRRVGTAWYKDSGGQEIDVLGVTKDNTGNPVGWKKFIQWPGEETYDRGDGSGYSIAEFKEKKKAKLVFTMEFEEPQRVSTIQISPQIIGGVYPIVNNISVSTEDGITKVVAENVHLTKKINESLKLSRMNIPEGNYTGVGVWSIPDKKIKSIKVSLESSGWYLPTIGLGHKYYFRILHKRSEVKVLFASFVSHKEWAERLPNPEEGISTGVSRNNLLQIGELAGLVFGGVIGGAIGRVAGSLINITSSTEVVREGSGWDVFSGERSAIGIKDIDISRREYEGESVLISKPHLFTKPVKFVSIISTEEIPEDWDDSIEWISYEISKDGYTWSKITPINRSKGDNDVIEIDSMQVFVKVRLSRPDDRPGETPILKHYAIKAIEK